MERIRIALAVVLARAIMRLIEGGDDRVVVLNTHRRRSLYGPRAGRVNAFITDRTTGSPMVFPPGETASSLGLPVSIHVARLAGKEPVTYDGSRAA
jgi:hypothetical protein